MNQEIKSQSGSAVPSSNLLEAERCECTNWARAINLKYLTNHHEQCPRYNDSLIDVWKMTVNGETCYFDNEQDLMDCCQDEFEDETTITKEKMHKEVYEHLPEFQGF